MILIKGCYPFSDLFKHYAVIILFEHKNLIDLGKSAMFFYTFTSTSAIRHWRVAWELASPNGI